jgi:hypothetical protein
MFLQPKRHILKLIGLTAHDDGRQMGHDIQGTADAERQINDQIVGFDVDLAVRFKRGGRPGFTDVVTN